MKKFFLIGLLFFLTNSLVAQNHEILGIWKEDYSTKIDTTGNTNENPFAIATPQDSKFKVYKVNYIKVIPEKEAERLIITITRKKNTFWITSILGTEKLVYNSKSNRQFLKKGSYANRDLDVQFYEAENPYLLFLTEGTGMSMYRFSRK